MKLTDVLGLDSQKKVILIGKPEVTSIETTEGEPYYVARLKEPIMVRCSMDKGIEPLETDEVYIRESAVLGEDWSFVDETKPEEGYFMPNWVVDFSKGQEIPIYQSSTIAKWTKGERGNRDTQRRTGINTRIQERMKARKNG